MRKGVMHSPVGASRTRLAKVERSVSRRTSDRSEEEYGVRRGDGSRDSWGDSRTSPSKYSPPSTLSSRKLGRGNRTRSSSLRRDTPDSQFKVSPGSKARNDTYRSSRSSSSVRDNRWDEATESWESSSSRSTMSRRSRDDDDHPETLSRSSDRPSDSSSRYESSRQRSRYDPEKIRQKIIEEEFTTPSSSSSPTSHATSFTSPPLIPSLLAGVQEVLGPDARPTEIQALSLENLFDEDGSGGKTGRWKQALLASETGSGKSIAYMLPVFQSLKLSESSLPPSPSPSNPNSGRPTNTATEFALNPRALILAPTHELSRQLSKFAKALLHTTKLRVTCLSRSNDGILSRQSNSLSPGLGGTARRMKKEIEGSEIPGIASQEKEKERVGHDVDIIVGTPMKVLEMVKGRRWDKPSSSSPEDAFPGDLSKKERRKQHAEKERSNPKPEMGLGRVEWVVVDEADVLFGMHFLLSFLPSLRVRTIIDLRDRS